MNKLNASVTVTSGGGDTPPEPPVTDAIVLPATLNKANVGAYSDDMAWYNTDYFDFGPDDDHNLDRWATWNVYLQYPGEYLVSEVMKSVQADWGIVGHSWHIQLMSGSSVVSEYTTEGKWAEGELSYETVWDLSAVAQGEYTIKVMNATE